MFDFAGKGKKGIIKSLFKIEKERICWFFYEDCISFKKYMESIKNGLSDDEERKVAGIIRGFLVALRELHLDRLIRGQLDKEWSLLITGDGIPKFGNCVSDSGSLSQREDLRYLERQLQAVIQPYHKIYEKLKAVLQLSRYVAAGSQTSHCLNNVEFHPSFLESSSRMRYWILAVLAIDRVVEKIEIDLENVSSF